jgi:hypothetical protein
VIKLARGVRLAVIVVLLTVPKGGDATTATDASWASWHHERLTWYGPGFYGKRTACGFTMTRKLIGVASRDLPCGTSVQIQVLRHHAVVHDRQVTVVDAGPYGVPWQLDATARLMIHLTGKPPHSLSKKHVRWRVTAWVVW